MSRPFDALSVLIEPGPLALEASAGTGKTFAMVQLAMRILLGDTPVASRGPGHLLLVTFTRAAAAELKDRLRSAIDNARALEQGLRQPSPDQQWIISLLEHCGVKAGPRLEQLNQRMDQLSVSTINSFCANILRDFASECGVSGKLDFIEEDTPLQAEVLADQLRRLGWEDPWQAAALAGMDFSPKALEKETRPLSSDSEELPSIAEGRRLFLAELEQLRAIWDRENLSDLLDQAAWTTSKSLLWQADFRAAAVEQLHCLAMGDPAGMEGLAYLGAETLGENLKNRSNPEKAAREQLLNQPTILAVSRLTQALALWQSSLLREVARAVAVELPRVKAERGVASFNDQITMVAEALGDPERGAVLARHIAQQYDAILVDEAQDTNPQQWQIITQAFNSLPRLIVGDPKQSIYGWRGADLDAYLDQRDRAGSERTWHLSHNWRSSPALLQAIEALFTYSPEPFRVPVERMDFVHVEPGRDIPGLEDFESSAAMRWFVVEETLAAEPQRALMRRRMVAEIQRLLGGGVRWKGRPLQAGDIAVLVRTHQQATKYQQALRKVGINAVLAGSGDISLSPVWGEIHSLLRALSAPESPEHASLAAATLLAGFSATSIVAWQSEEEQQLLHAWMENLQQLSEIARSRGATAGLSALLSDRYSLPRLAAASGGERLLTDLRHTLSLLQEQEQLSGSSAGALARWMEQIGAEEERPPEQRRLRLESDDDAVQIRTVFAAKGLEYPVVFLPDVSSQFLSRADKDQPENDEARRRESMRLLYVAVTRPQARCYLALSGSSGQHDLGAVGYLLGGDQEKPSVTGLLPALMSRVDSSADIMDIVPPESIDPPTSPPLQPMSLPPLQAGLLPRAPIISRRVVSYSSLSRRASPISGETLRDYDEVVDAVLPMTSAESAATRPLLPPGTQTGLALHALLEDLDFAADDAEISRQTRKTLQRYGLVNNLDDLRSDDLITQVTEMTARLLRNPVPEWGFALNQIPRHRSLREWNIILRLDRGDLEHLAENFASMGPDFAGYAEEVAALEPAHLEGFLNGIVDLVFEHQGGWYLVDWKSNWLGNEPDSYSRPAMHETMRRNHYYLQREVYRRALQRFLALRAPEAEVVGAGYAFIRGGTWLT